MIRDTHELAGWIGRAPGTGVMDEQQLFEGLLEEYHLESRERLEEIESALLSLEQASAEERQQHLITAQRELHTLKGNSGMMGFVDLQELAHRLEDQLQEVRSGDQGLGEMLAGVDLFRRLLERTGRPQKSFDEAPAKTGAVAEARAETSPTRTGLQEGVRVSFAALDSLVDLLSEMVIFRNRLSEALGQGLARLDKRERTATAWREVEAAHQTLYRTLAEIQTGIMRLRMVPMGSFFAQLRRIAHDESAAQGKKVAFRASGGDTPLDKALLEVASEAMGHLVRNAIVHGLEEPDERRSMGKPPTGRIEVLAVAQAEEVIIDIQDDGRGIDRATLLELARERGFDVADNMELQALLALPGLSTKMAADRSAGRGMGMAAVMESVRRRGGQVEVYSAVGQGTRFRLRLPLTAAILRALLVSVDEEVYALPLMAVQETVQLTAAGRHTMNHADVLEWRGSLVPLLDLGLAFDTATTPRKEGYVILIEAEGRHRGLVVDAIAGIQDVVVKALDEVAGAPAGLAGCTILGDGRVVLILDPTGLTLLSPFLEPTE
jgi:two-component system, chemotaxis family, sensor kinase CheA